MNDHHSGKSHNCHILWSVGLISCMGEEIKKGVSEEFMSLRSSAKHKASVGTSLSSSLVLHSKFKEHDYLGDKCGTGGLVIRALICLDYCCSSTYMLSLSLFISLSLRLTVFL